MSTVTGNHLMADTLAGLGVDTIFTVPGTQTIGLLDALRGRVRLVLASHELGAAFMANGYARASGKPGVLLTIPGPGFGYAVAGLAEASHDSVPLVYLVGRPPTPGPATRYHLQYLPQTEIAQPFLKAVLTVERPDDGHDALRRAFHQAAAGGPGPVMVQLPLEQLGARLSSRAPSVPQVLAAETVPEAWAELATRWREARRPLLFVGQGAGGCAGEISALASTAGCPVVTTPSGRGILSEDHPLAIGADFVRGGAAILNALCDAADLVMAVGCRFSHNGTGGFALRLPRERLVHIDADAEALGANYPAVLTVHAEAEPVMRHLARMGRDRSAWTPAAIADWRRRIRRPVSTPEPMVQGAPEGRVGQWIRALRRVVPRHAVVTLDSGRHQELVRRHWDVLAPRTLLFPSDFQSMGYAIPAAIGAKAADPARPVVAVVGDGGFAMSGLELMSALRESLPITVVVMNDGALGLIRAQQHAAFGRATVTDLRNPDFAALAQALGASYLRLGPQWAAHLGPMLAGNTPGLVEVVLGESARGRAIQAAGMVRSASRRVRPGWLAKVRDFLKRLG